VFETLITTQHISPIIRVGYSDAKITSRMKKTFKMMLLTLVIISIAIGGIYLFLLKVDDVDMNVRVSTQIVEFKELDEKVYIRAMAWGIAGNHNEVILSAEPIKPETRKSEKDKDYIFYTTEMYYKKQGSDTLLIYVEESSIGKCPDNFTKKVKVITMKIKTYDEAKDYEKNYKAYGLLKVSAYPDK
jgi:hypothetical protein